MYGAVLSTVNSKSGSIIASGIFALSLGGCVINIDYGGSAFRCELSEECPPGFTCVDQVCAVVSDGGVDPGPDAAPPIDEALIGNVLYYPFEGDYEPTSLTYDRGPNHIPGERSNAIVVAGHYGNAHEFDDEDGAAMPRAFFTEVPDSPRLFVGSTITIEAWVEPDELQDQAIFGDFAGGDTPNVEYAFELTSTGDLEFYSNSGCADGNEVVATTGQNIPIDMYTHVAVTWDGTEVIFYVNGVAAGAPQPFAHTPCEFSGFRKYRLGRREGGGRQYDGEIDELKVSDYAKTAEQIVASMSFDPTLAYPSCGDLFVEGGEQCDGQAECCNLATCQFEPDSTACSGGGSCSSGVCTPASPARVTDGLLALYNFDEGAGATVGDAVDPALDLTIQDVANVTWGTGTLTVDTSTIIASGAAATKISDACIASNELTMEAWVTPGNDTQGGPSRIFTVSLDSGSRNVTLAQQDDTYMGRVRTQADGNGSPEVATPRASVNLAGLDHVVVTRRANGERRIYLNGILVGFDFFDGDLSTWDNSWLLALANEFIDDRTWLGTLALVAVYGRSLSDAEVMQNFAAGP